MSCEECGKDCATEPCGFCGGIHRCEDPHLMDDHGNYW